MLAEEEWRCGRVHTRIVDVDSFALLSFASSSRLAGLLDSCRSSSRRLARSFAGSGGVGRFAGSCGSSFAQSDLTELLQVLLDSAGSAMHLIGSQLEER